MTLTALVVDDEPLAREELIYLLLKTGKVRILGEAASGPDAVRLIRERRPDVVFLDVQMPEMSGFEVAHQLPRDGTGPAVVFATAHDEFALQAFEVHAMDYLLKPFDHVRVTRTVQRLESITRDQPGRALEELEGFLTRVMGLRPLQRLSLHWNGRNVLVSPSEVLYASSGESGTLVRTDDNEYQTAVSLQELEERLATAAFLRIHRQYVVNLHRVAEFIPWPGGTASLVLNDKKRTQVPVARTQVRRVKELLGIP